MILLSRNKLIEGLKQIEGLDVTFDQPMSLHTSFRLGGPADIMVIPFSLDSFLKAIDLCKLQRAPYFVMGNGSNLIVRDKGIRGVVFKLAGGLTEISVKENCITAQAGVLLSKLSRVAAQHSLSGLEFAEGIPGTVGGAIAMNAGAYGGEMKNVVKSTVCVDVIGNIVKLDDEMHEFGYRKSAVKTNGLVVLITNIVLEKKDNVIITEKMKEFSKLRTDKQPINLPSAGSTFKRPEGFYAGSLIEECGLKGCQIGGAQVSTKHCGFIVNNGNAKAKDVLDLILHVQDQVGAQKGVKMETEVLIIGEE